MNTVPETVYSSGDDFELKGVTARCAAKDLRVGFESDLSLGSDPKKAEQSGRLQPVLEPDLI